MLTVPVVILCGGLGTRLRSEVSDRPKALAPVGEKSFLQLQIEAFRDAGAGRFVLCVGHMAEQIEAAFGDGSALGVCVEYSRDGDVLLGTGGALKRAEQHFAPVAVVVNGDTHLTVDLAELLRAHETNGCAATLTLSRVPDASRFGTVEVSGARVLDFHEKAATGGPGLVNAGAYAISRELLARVPAGEVVSLERDVFPSALRAGVPLGALVLEGAFTDIGTPDDYRAFARERAHAS
jgi:NDP-sugar pyrophosphorylase family protein